MAERSGGRTPAGRYPDSSRRRLALPPAVIAVIALAVGFPFVEAGGFLIVRFVVAILALICGWYAVQARQWWWTPLLAAIAVLWNPVFPLSLGRPWWSIAQGLAAIVFLVVGASVRVRVEGDRVRGASGRR